MTDPARRQFWKSAGFHLVERDRRGWLTVTPDYLRAYLTRPEIHPVEDSCAAEIALFEALLADPFRPVADTEIAALADTDAAGNYRFLLRFRDILAAAGTVEAAYLRLFHDGVSVPPVFIDQMVHLILRNCLDGVADPMRLRAAEIFFRDQTVSLDEGRVMLADEEIVETFAESGGLGALGQLLKTSETPLRQVSLDVLDDETGEIYWDRSDRFDTVVDFRFTQPAVDAFARVIEAWIAHFHGLTVGVRPVQKIADERWSWHVGLDADATRILNALYDGRDVSLDDLQQILALFVLEFSDPSAVMPNIAGKPVYLGLAMNRAGKLKMKPQNLLMNLPLAAKS